MPSILNNQLPSGVDVRDIRIWLNDVERRVRSIEQRGQSKSGNAGGGGHSGSVVIGIAKILAGGTADIYRGVGDLHKIAEGVSVTAAGGTPQEGEYMVAMLIRGTWEVVPTSTEARTPIPAKITSGPSEAGQYVGDLYENGWNQASTSIGVTIVVENSSDMVLPSGQPVWVRWNDVDEYYEGELEVNPTAGGEETTVEWDNNTIPILVDGWWKYVNSRTLAVVGCSANDSSPDYLHQKIADTSASGTYDSSTDLTVYAETMNDGGNETEKLYAKRSEIETIVNETGGGASGTWWRESDSSTYDVILDDANDYRGRHIEAWAAMYPSGNSATSSTDQSVVNCSIDADVTLLIVGSYTLYVDDADGSLHLSASAVAGLIGVWVRASARADCAPDTCPTGLSDTYDVTVCGNTVTLTRSGTSCLWEWSVGGITGCGINPDYIAIELDPGNEWSLWVQEGVSGLAGYARCDYAKPIGGDPVGAYDLTSSDGTVTCTNTATVTEAT